MTFFFKWFPSYCSSFLSSFLGLSPIYTKTRLRRCACMKGCFTIHAHTGRRVSRIWKRGGLFWKSEKSANDLDPNFYCSWISFTRFLRKLSWNFLESSEVQTFFPLKNRWKKKVFTKIESEFSAKIGNSNTFSYRITTSTSRLAPTWGAVFNFSPKIGLKSNKNVRFCILHKPMGGSSLPAPPGYATAHRA